MLGFPGQLASNVNVIESFEGRLRSKLRPLFVSFTGVTGKPYFQLNDAFRRPLTVKLCFAGFPLAVVICFLDKSNWEALFST